MVFAGRLYTGTSIGTFIDLRLDDPCPPVSIYGQHQYTNQFSYLSYLATGIVVTSQPTTGYINITPNVIKTRYPGANSVANIQQESFHQERYDTKIDPYY